MKTKRTALQLANGKADDGRWKTKMDAQIDAKWWIDNRYNLPSDSSKQAAREAVRLFNEVFNK